MRLAPGKAKQQITLTLPQEATACNVGEYQNNLSWSCAQTEPFSSRNQIRLLK